MRQPTLEPTVWIGSPQCALRSTRAEPLAAPADLSGAEAAAACPRSTLTMVRLLADAAADSARGSGDGRRARATR